VTIVAFGQLAICVDADASLIAIGVFAVQPSEDAAFGKRWRARWLQRQRVADDRHNGIVEYARGLQ
jgi:hypothetical protein